MFMKFIIRTYIKILRNLYPFYFIFAVIFNIKIHPKRGSYNALLQNNERLKLLELKLREQINKFKKIYQYKNKKKFIYFEIGSYIGSSLVFAGNILKKELNNNFIIFSIDPFVPYNKKTEKEWGVRELSNSINKLFLFFMYRISIQEWRNNSIHLRKTSIQAKDFFEDYNILADFIYIDGSHYYKDIKNDIENYSRLAQVKKNYRGFICGDDLELTFQDLMNLNSQNKNKVIKLLKNNLTMDQVLFNGKYFHPGLTLALYEFSVKYKKKIYNKFGFWYL